MSTSGSAGDPTGTPSGYPTGFPTVTPTEAHLLRTGVQYWINNNFVVPSYISNQPSFYSTAWGMVSLGIFVILHSFYLHRFSFKMARVLVDICAVGNILAGSFLLLGFAYNDTYLQTWFINFGISFLAGMLTQLPDNLMFLLGYYNVNKKFSWPFTICVSLYIIFVLYFSWIFQWTFFPFIFNENSKDFLRYYSTPCANYVYTYGTIAYNIFFTYSFVVILLRVHVWKTIRVPRNSQIFIMKCCLHFFASSFAGAQYFIWTDETGYFNYDLIMLISLHALFNFQVEAVLKTKEFARFSNFVRRRRQQVSDVIGAVFPSRGESNPPTNRRSLYSIINGARNRRSNNA